MALIKIFVVVFVLCHPATVLAYIGPGAGIAVLGSIVAVFTATLSALVALSTWPIRHLIRAIKRGRIFVILMQSELYFISENNYFCKLISLYN